MKYYSEHLNKIFDTVDELKAAEKVWKEEERKKKMKQAEKEARIREIEVAYDELQHKVEAFAQDYAEDENALFDLIPMLVRKLETMF